MERRDVKKQERPVLLAILWVGCIHDVDPMWTFQLDQFATSDPKITSRDPERNQTSLSSDPLSPRPIHPLGMQAYCNFSLPRLLPTHTTSHGRVGL
jgi:hypothetical protein